LFLGKDLRNNRWTRLSKLIFIKDLKRQKTKIKKIVLTGFEISQWFNIWFETKET
jgi:hypothetical protein